MAFGQETNAAVPASTEAPAVTDSQELLQAIGRVEGQLRSNQLAIEQSWKESSEAAARNASAVSNGLHSIEGAFAVQQKAFAALSAQEVEAMRNSNRVLQALSGATALITCLAMFLVVFFQWRITRAWGQISKVLPPTNWLGRGPAVVSVSADAPGTHSGVLAEEPSQRLAGTIQQLERRIQELEQLGVPVLRRGDGDNGRSSARPGNGPSLEGATGTGPSRAQIAALLAQGHELVKKGELNAALACYDQVLALDPNHGETLVRKGAALERMQKLNEAFECYDRAIAADRSMTIAYLHKGGLCNRLERFREALECYEQALRTHGDWRG